MVTMPAAVCAHVHMQARRWEVEGGMQALTGTSSFLRCALFQSGVRYSS